MKLYERLTEVLGTRDVVPADRIKIQNAFLEAGGDGARWEDLPPDIQDLVEQAERLPVQAWDDPMDVPDELPA